MYEKKTIEEKAKAYDEATKIIKANLDALNDITEMGERVVNIQSIKNCFYRAFPELIESEDEKIRRLLIRLFTSNTNEKFDDVSTREIIAWLEKQRKIVDEYEDKLDRCACENFNKGYKAAIEHQKEKQGKQNLPSVNERAWLYLVDDVLTRNNGIGQYLDDPRVQKLAKDLCSEYAQKLYNFPISSNSSNIENNKQEPADKDKPKFKIEEGKWYVCTQTYTLQGKIVAIKGQTYKSNQDGAIEGEDRHLFIDKVDGKAQDYFKPWTIQDAKDGDVLASNLVGIYRESGLDYFSSYCFIGSDGKFYTGDTGCDIIGIHPATKEQRNLLFAKMKEAGYEWGAEKKKLKKIEQKPEHPYCQEHCKGYKESGGKCYFGFDCEAKREAEKKPVWNEEDEKEFEKIIDHFDWNSNNGFSHSDCNRAQDWLKSLKGRIQPQPKQEWSKEDEGLFDLLHTCVCLSINDPYWEYSKREKVSKEIIPFIDRLKSLRPLNAWKPSDEQLDALRYIWQHYTPAVTERKAWESLKNIEILYGQLKKQKED